MTDNPSAFPGDLRDYFAAHAPPMPCELIDPTDTPKKRLMRIVEWRWTYAGAMLKEREKPRD